LGSGDWIFPSPATTSDLSKKDFFPADLSLEEKFKIRQKEA
jgi:hypothetical protein